MNYKNGIVLDSPRLTIVPLTQSQIIKYMKTDNSLENELQLTPLPRIIPTDLLNALQKDILPRVADPAKNFLYNTLWVIIEKEKQVMVGDLCLKGVTDEKGNIEIGYGIYPSFQRSGYITEAIGSIIQWASGESAIKAIIAETAKSNLASIRVLEKNNFRQFKTTETMIWWQLKVK